MFTNKQTILKESVFGGVVFTLVILFLNTIPFKFEFIKPIKQEFEDFDIYDLYYSNYWKNIHTEKDGLINNSLKSKNIILIQSETDRASILTQLKNIQKLEPKVIGIDLFFEGNKNLKIDSSLRNYIHSQKNIICGYNIDTIIDGSIIIQNQPITEGADFAGNKMGYINLPYLEEYDVIRKYSPYTKNNELLYYSFAVQLFRFIDSQKWNSIKQNIKEHELIDYTGNLGYYSYFTAKNYNRINPDSIKDKIVIIGDFHPELKLNEDLKYSPLNRKFSGRTFPDMYGLVVHANFIEQLILGKYIYNVPKLFNYFLAFIVCTLLVFFILKDTQKNGHASHIKFILLNSLLVFLCVWGLLELFSKFKIRFELSPIIMAFIIPLELFEIYKKFANLMNKIFNYKTILQH